MRRSNDGKPEQCFSGLWSGFRSDRTRRLGFRLAQGQVTASGFGLAGRLRQNQTRGPRAILPVMPQPERERRPATYEDLLKVPDNLVAEILDGELYASPRPTPRHADASSELDLSLLWE